VIARRAAALACLCSAALSLSAASQDYRKFVGQQKEICGKVVEVTDAFKRKCDVALMLGSRADKWKFAAVIPKSARGDVSVRPEAYLLTDLCVSGQVVEEKKKPYIKVESREQLRIAKGQPFWPDAARSCDDGVEDPAVVTEVQPVYTRAAMQALAQGAVEVEALVGIDGAVADTRIVRRLHPDLDAQALAATRQWRFRPGTVKGVPAPMVVIIELTFTLK
jgi:TonB family protein